MHYNINLVKILAKQYSQLHNLLRSLRRNSVHTFESMVVMECVFRYCSILEKATLEELYVGETKGRQLCSVV